MRGNKVIASTAALLLVVLVTLAVVLVTTSNSAPTINTAHLQVGPGPPRTATGILSYADTTGLSIVAPCTFDFVHHAADIDADASVSVESLSVEIRVLGQVGLLNEETLSSLTGAPWVAIHLPRAPDALDAFARILRHPDLARLHADRAVVTTTGTSMTTTMWFNHVTLPSTSGLPISLPTKGALVLRVVEGAQGQLLDVRAHLFGQHDDIHVDFQLTGYNQPVEIALPARGEIVTLSPKRARQIFGVNTGAILTWLERAGAVKS